MTDETSEHFYRNALLWIYDSCTKLPFILKEPMEQKTQQSTPFTNQPQRGIGNYLIQRTYRSLQQGVSFYTAEH
ncbi:MAG: hypothetical protein DMG75_02935 [Acidobacteria bacterium]|nr:MAG: hypothetical protein DMG75_02935 [Acidobacteriota bacterium]